MAAAATTFSSAVGAACLRCSTFGSALGSRAAAASVLARASPALTSPRVAAARPAALYAQGSSWSRSFSTGWGLHGMYGGPDVDPTHGRVKWHMLDQRPAKEHPPLGALNTKEYDEKHGRGWYQRKEEWRPKLYTTIGRHARSKKLKRTIVRFVYRSPNFQKLKRDPYRKRWPTTENLCVRFFAEFCLKEYSKRTLLETAHTLPLFGVGTKFWRQTGGADCEDTKGHYLVATSADFRLRPIRGLIRGTQYMFGRRVRDNIAPVAKSLGSWRYEFPKDGHPLVYRPAFPELGAHRKAAAATE